MNKLWDTQIFAKTGKMQAQLQHSLDLSLLLQASDLALDDCIQISTCEENNPGKGS